MTPRAAIPSPEPATPARAFIAKRQRRAPPLYARRDGLDRVQQLSRLLEPGLPDGFRALIADGTVAIGEVGSHIPYARAISLEGGGFVVEMTSGMMDFQYAMGRALSGLDSNNARLPQVQTLSDVAVLVERVLRDWGSYIKWSRVWPWRRRIARPSFPITQQALQGAELTVTTGELFILAHELGHVALDAGLVKATSENAEEAADRCGMQFFLAATEKLWHRRMAFEGPIVAIRNLAALQQIGVEFSEQYAAPSERLRILREEIVSRCPSAQYFHETATMMVAYQDMLDDIDHHISPTSPRAEHDWERILIRLIAELIEVGKGKVSVARYIEDLGFVFAGRDPVAIRKATTVLFQYYLPLSIENDAFISIQSRAQMSEALARTVNQLPPALRPLFPTLRTSNDIQKA